MSTSQEITVMKMEVTPDYPAEQHIVCLCDSPPQQQQQKKKKTEHSSIQLLVPTSERNDGGEMIWPSIL